MVLPAPLGLRTAVVAKEALINLQKLLKAIKEHQTKGILQRFLKILKWGYAPIPRASRGLMKFQALKGVHTVDGS